MNESAIFFLLLTLGVAGHLFMRRSMDAGNFLRRMFAGQHGEGEAGAGAEVKFDDKQQAYVNKLIDGKAKEYHTKLSTIEKEYQDLKQFKTEYEKSKEAQTQKELEDQKKYDEAKKTYEKQISDLSTKLTDKDRAIQDRDINFALTNEISKQNGFTEETIAMIKGRASLDANGSVIIKDKDANGLDVNLSVEAGVQKFLKERPHLVKASNKNGAGSGAGDGGQGAGAVGKGEDLASLNEQYAVAMRGTDLKLRSTLRAKIAAAMSAKGVAR